MIVKEATSPAATPFCPDRFTDVQLRQFAELIYRRCGVRIPLRKRLLLSNRLRRRLRRTGIADFGRYYNHLLRLPADDPEWDAFIQEVTTHETYLFRDETHWEWFRDVFLTGLAAAARRGEAPRTLRIWSAACSTGDEPVSAACCIAAALPNFRQWRIQVLGTDVGRGALGQAAGGAFGPGAMRLVPEGYRRRFFTKLTGSEAWRVRPVVADMLAFRRHNLMEPLDEGGFDLIMLKNVLIYFDAKSKSTVIRNVCATLKPGGFLMTGAAEGATSLLKNLQRIEPWLHQRPGQ